MRGADSECDRQRAGGSDEALSTPRLLEAAKGASAERGTGSTEPLARPAPTQLPTRGLVPPDVLHQSEKAAE